MRCHACGGQIRWDGSDHLADPDGRDGSAYARAVARRVGWKHRGRTQDHRVIAYSRGT